MNFNNPQTPGVYIQELNAFPNSVVEVATAIPAFIGYTEKANYNGQSLFKMPLKITTLNDFITYFGSGPGSRLQFTLTPSTTASAPDALSAVLPLNGSSFSLAIKGSTFYLYNSIRLFYQNGGCICYIISMGTYDSVPSKQDFLDGLVILDNEQDPTMVLFPDALSLTRDDYYAVASQAIVNSAMSQRRMAIVDVHGGAVTDPAALVNPNTGVIPDFRKGVGMTDLNYGAAYFPWLHTTVLANTEICFSNFPDLAPFLETAAPVALAWAIAKAAGTDAKKVMQAHTALFTVSANYKSMITAATTIANVLPPSPAMAGIYTYVDVMSGVWKSPANVGLTGVTAPTISLNDEQQASLNVDAMTGKSVNVIRAFIGQGVLVWGARTLDGNSQDWRYINVRRTMIMIEQSVKLAARAYVFEPNVAETWMSVKGMISNFLNNLWKQGALAGAKPEDAYSVSVGLGSTMTGDDILNGIMNVTVLVAISHPAEFIVLTFQQQMQKS